MTTPRDPDEILAAWLDEGPTRLPDQTRRAISVALPTTPQRRRGWSVPWRTQPMNQTTKFALGLVAVVAIAAGGLYLTRPATAPAVGGQASPSPTAPPTPSSAPSAGAVTSGAPSGSLGDDPTILSVVATATGCSADPVQLASGPLAPETQGWISVTNDSPRSVFFQLNDAPTAAKYEEFRLYMQAEHERVLAGQALKGPATFVGFGASRLVPAGATDRFRAPTQVGFYGIACDPADGNNVVDVYLVGPLEVAP